jgi:hypothetical protein
MKMKIGYLKIFVITCLAFVANCSSQQEEKPQEIRFVDLQGNARAIKTRVPEANARIMSGQSTNSSEINNERIINKKSFVEAPNYYNKNSINQKNTSGPKFTDADSVEKTSPEINLKDNSTSASDQVNQDSEGLNNNPVIEYDLSKDDEKNNKNSGKNSFSQKESNKNLDSESEELNSNLSKKSRSNNSEEEYSTEEDQFADSSVKNLNSKNKKSLKKNAKIITYSAKKIKKNKPPIAINESEENSVEEQSEGESSQKIYRSGGGRIYVQVGSFFTSKGAKERLNLTKEFGKGKVQVAYNKSNKRIYRSVYGPFKSKNSAIDFRDKVLESGNEAIIIRGK